MPAVNQVTYSWTDLEQWKGELQENRDKHALYVQQIEEQNAFLIPLREQLLHINNQIDVLQKQLEAFSQSEEIIQSSLTFSFFFKAQIVNQQSRLNELQAQRERLIEQAVSYETAVSALEEHIHELDVRYQWLHTHIPPAAMFLMQLHQDPLQLVAELENRLTKVINKYEEQHFVGLSSSVRSGFWAWYQGRQQLIQPSDNPQVQQENYLRLCGFIHELYSQVLHEGKDLQFCSALASVINKIPILAQETIPYLWEQCSAESCYQYLKEQHPDIFGLSNESLLAQEELLFNNSLDYLLRNVPHYTRLQQEIAHTAETLLNEVEAKRARDEAIDYHFYTRIASNLQQLHDNAYNIQASKNLARMAEHATGTFSLGKQLLGCFLVVLGAALIGASIAGFIATLGSSSFVSAGSLVLGLTLLQTKIVISTGCYITAAAGAGITFWGRGALKDSMRCGFSQELKDIEKEAEEPIGYMPQFAY